MSLFVVSLPTLLRKYSNHSIKKSRVLPDYLDLERVKVYRKEQEVSDNKPVNKVRFLGRRQSCLLIKRLITLPSGVPWVKRK
jgi:hypothetical protein